MFLMVSSECCSPQGTGGGWPDATLPAQPPRCWALGRLLPGALDADCNKPVPQTCAMPLACVQAGPWAESRQKSRQGAASSGLGGCRERRMGGVGLSRAEHRAQSQPGHESAGLQPRPSPAALWPGGGSWAAGGCPFHRAHGTPGRQEAGPLNLEDDPVIWMKSGQGAGLGCPGCERLTFPGWSSWMGGGGRDPRGLEPVGPPVS